MGLNTREGRTEVAMTVNGAMRSGWAEPRTLLSDFLRSELHLHGTNVGCEQGVCGACSVRIDGEIARSCITLAVQVDGADIRTVEGMRAKDGQLHPIQEAFREAHALQCGYCTPGFLLTVEQLLEESPRASEREIREFLAGNVCRCTGYQGIIAAVLALQPTSDEADDGVPLGGRR
jgi:aerobic-type carbon monoxide dehydrogenase small subunit (CoxS/CutS family)